MIRSLLAATAVLVVVVLASAQEPVTPRKNPDPATPAVNAGSQNNGQQENEGARPAQNRGALPTGENTRVVVYGAIAVMLLGLGAVSWPLYARQQGFGPNSLKALGLVLFIPTLLIAAVMVPGFQSETLAALLGTVGGYVLSHSRSEDR